MSDLNAYIAQYFNEEEYLQNKTDALNAYDSTHHWTVELTKKAITGAEMTSWQHFATFGAFERAADGGYGINPSEKFDVDLYYHDKSLECGIENFDELLSDFRNASLNPITHFALCGESEGLNAKNEDGMIENSVNYYINNYFNEDEYIQNKTDQLNGIEVYVNQKEATWTPELTRKAISDAGMTPWEHFHQFGAYEIRYLSRYMDDGQVYWDIDYGVDPSDKFDISEYYDEKATYLGLDASYDFNSLSIEWFKNKGVNPISDYAMNGKEEGMHIVMNENAEASIEYPDALPTPSDPKFYSNKIPLTGEDTIDALLFTDAVNWNKYGATYNTNTLRYNYTDFIPDEYIGAYSDAVFTPFNGEQKLNSKLALDYVSYITGINFEETSNVKDANLLFFCADSEYYSGFALIGQNQIRIPVTTASKYKYNEPHGISTLLHEIGHAIGLKHPFTEFDGNSTVLSQDIDKRSNTIMSYTNDIPYNLSYEPYDFAALNYLYGGDGLNGEHGLVYLTGVQQTNGGV